MANIARAKLVVATGLRTSIVESNIEEIMTRWGSSRFVRHRILGDAGREFD